MSLETHGDHKYRSGALIGGAADYDQLRVEHRHVVAGAQDCVRSSCTELVYIISGQATVRRTGDGLTQEGLALPGTSWLVPAGTHETLLELDADTECLMIYLPDRLLEESAMADFGIDPAATRLAYAGGFLDPTLAQIATTLHGLVGRAAGPMDRVFAQGLRTALAAHLIGSYSVDHWQPEAERRPTLDARRLRRVLDFIAARFADDISLDDLASKACLSPFHFSRLFRESTGRSPHRYLSEYRIAQAKQALVADEAPITGIALDAGYGSQANFARAFRKATGMSPGQFRALNRR